MIAPSPLSLRYPESVADRDRWIIAQRGPRNFVDPQIPYAFVHEQEAFADGSIGRVNTIFLTNRECPWRCAMCDLWKNTLTTTVPVGSIPAQIRHALARLPAARQIKLYNSGSFFDRAAIPFEDYEEIASLCASFERVIVESHPSLIGEASTRLQALLKPQLEVAMGLETAHPDVLEKLNKKMTLAQYAAAASRLAHQGIALRSFILIQPPFMALDEVARWSRRSIDFAIECGASAITLLPTRGGNGTMEQFALDHSFTPPHLETLEETFDYGISIAPAGTRIFVDLWDIARVEACTLCRPARIERLEQMNLTQVPHKRIACETCGGSA